MPCARSTHSSRPLAPTSSSGAPPGWKGSSRSIAAEWEWAMLNIGMIMLRSSMSIAAALFTESQTRVLRWLFGQPDRDYHLNELLRLTGLGSASLQRELRKLAEAGLVRSEKVRNLRKFQANRESPVYGELVALTRKTLGVEPLLRNALEP